MDQYRPFQRSSSEEYDLFAVRVVRKPLSNFQAFVCLLKSTLATGMLAMPKAFSEVGWAYGIIYTLIFAIVYVASIHILISNMNILCARKGLPYLTLGEAMEVALKEGPLVFRCFASFFRWITNPLLALLHFGVCCTYVYFIANNLYEWTGGSDAGVDIHNIILLMLLLLMPVFMIRDFRKLVGFAIVANILMVIGFCTLLLYFFSELPPLSERKAFVNIAYLPQFSGNVLLAINSVGLFLTVERQMKNSQDFGGWTGVLNWAIAVIVPMYIMVGFFGYWRYGEKTEYNIVLNLPNSNHMALISKIAYTFGIYFTYALQGYILVDIFWHQYLEPVLNQKSDRPLEFLVRLVVLIASVLVALFYNEFEKVISLIGTFCVATLGLVFPGVLDICTRYNKNGYGPYKMWLWLDILLISNFFALAGFWIVLINNHVHMHPK